MVMDVASGEVLAMVSLPSFDPERPGAAPADNRFNRASLGLYEMGSVFKIFTTAMALDEGVVTLADGYDTSKPIRVARFTITDFKPKKRWLSVPEIFMYSSNIGTVHMAMDAGTAAQQSFLERLGLTRPSSIELSEVGTPMLPSPWREINTMTIAYGHGLAVSPVQLTGAVAAVVNGGEFRPATLLKRPVGEAVPGTRIMDRDTSLKMRRLMRLVVRRGTGRQANAEGYRVGGKTGTADKLVGRVSNGRAAIRGLRDGRRTQGHRTHPRLRHRRLGCRAGGARRGRTHRPDAGSRAGPRGRGARRRRGTPGPGQGEGTDGCG
jgi:cell division protein FtsI (penicillin-binding protein 3)